MSKWNALRGNGLFFDRINRIDRIGGIAIWSAAACRRFHNGGSPPFSESTNQFTAASRLVKAVASHRTPYLHGGRNNVNRNHYRISVANPANPVNPVKKIASLQKQGGG